jgi:chromate transporter
MGLKWLAVVVVLDAVIGLYSRFCDTAGTRTIALLTLATLVVWPGVGGQLMMLLLAAIWGAGRRNAGPGTVPEGTQGRLHLGSLVLFLMLAGLGGLGWLGGLWPAFYQAGALVFGGGHVVLPLLQATVGDAVSQDAFLLGYAVAQALPGPLFALAAYLGALMQPETPLLGAALATLAIFLPGFLLLLAVRDYWQALLARPRINSAVSGINAAVVGLLMAALYQPVFVQAIQASWHLVPVAIGFLLLRRRSVPLVVLVLGFALGGVGLGALPWLA